MDGRSGSGGQEQQPAAAPGKEAEAFRHGAGGSAARGDGSDGEPPRARGWLAGWEGVVMGDLVN